MALCGGMREEGEEGRAVLICLPLAAASFGVARSFATAYNKCQLIKSFMMIAYRNLILLSSSFGGNFAHSLLPFVRVLRLAPGNVRWRE